MKLITLTGAGGIGKDSILKELLNRNSKLNNLVSNTSRPMRKGEKDGVDYNFKTVEEMNNLLKTNGLLESRVYTVASGEKWIYGIPIDSLDWNSDNIYITIVDVDGFKQIKKAFKNKCRSNDLISFYIDGSYQTRYTRYFNRATTKKMSDEEFMEFIKEAHRRFLDDNYNVVAFKDKFDHIISNDDRPLNNTVNEILGVLKTYGI